MSEFNQHINPAPNGQGDPNWQRLFDDASEMPPPRVWDAIERDLDREEDDRVIIVPFWGRSSTWAWSAAAAVALLFVGWWSVQTTAPNSSTVETQSVASPPVQSRSYQQQTADAKQTADTKQPAPANWQPIADAQETARANRQPTQQIAGATETAPADREPIASLRKNNPINQQNDANLAGERPNRTDETIAVSQPVAGVSVPKEPLPSIAPETSPAEIALATLTSRPVQFPSMYGTQRIVWFRPSETSTAPTESASEKPQSEHWASVSVMPSSFNPGVGLQQASATYGNTFTKSSNPYSADPSLNSQPNLSVAYQISSGLQLTNRWSVETGVGYLEGRSTVNSPVQTIVSALAPNGRLSNLYADALNNSRVSADFGNNTSNPQVGGAPNTGSGGNPGLSNSSNTFLNTNVYDIARPQQLSNNYTFVQVPVQLGYQIRPRKRLGFTLLGGLLTNLFVRNTVNNQLSITNSDMVYRPVTLSASTGVRFRYRPTRRWSASMAGIFQQALQRGTRVGADLTTRPQTMGVSVGLDYHF